MDYKTFFADRFSARLSKQEVLEIAHDVIEHRDSFGVLIDAVIDGDQNQSFMASWVMTHVVDKKKELLHPYVVKLFEYLKSGNTTESTRRNTLRTLEHAAFPDSIKSDVINLCFGYLTDNSQPIAVKAFAMPILFQCAIDELDILKELKLVLEEQLDIQSSGFKNRASKLINKIDKRS